MIPRFILWISHLWGLLCELIMPSTPVTQTPSPPASQTQLTLVSSSTPTQYDVFLSFRGKDTRLTFTGHLYDKLDANGISTFKDDPELRSGEVISDALLDAIRNSKTYIVVFSENYATSPWCLDELAEILSCHKTMQRCVIPVFFNIDPSVVRHQTGSFQKAFKKLQKRFRGEREKLENWQLTLKEVADFSGHHISKDRSEADVINEIVDELLLKINPKTLDVAKYPVGLDYRVEAITRMLSSDTKGVIRIGIHGMGGVGKTTLAKAVYNKHYRSFHGSCFLADVREASTRENGLVSLQQKLIDNVLKRKNERIDNVDQGIEMIRARICFKKVLIVIDDLDNIMPLEFIVGPFALGSIIIITTRNEDLLDSVRVEARYKVNGLGDAESLQLFMQHAFGDNKIPDTFTELSQEILEHAGGLPLALKVFGSNLLNQSEEDRRWFINKLKRVPIEDVENKLKISYQALKSVDPMLQNIYLDIACFFVGCKKKEVVNIMETCYTFVNRHIDILNKRCLLTTNDEDELEMHDLLQDMGRNIARNESPDEPEKHSRLWVSKDICDVLKKKKGTEAVECIIPLDNNRDTLEGLSFTTKTFESMSKLRFLHLEEVSHVFGKLKILNMSYSRDLVATPDFIRLPSLETLNLKGCESLEEVHMSIGSLKRLGSLNLEGCKKLRSLPDTICDLRALKVLNISYCSSLEALPLQLGNIKSLTKLNAGELSVSELPVSIGDLNKLVELDLSKNKNLESLPNTICNLRALEVLRINDCSNVKALPVKLGNIESLKKLSARSLSVSKLPDSIGDLNKLVELDLSRNEKLETLPDTIGNLRSLETLRIASCKKLQALPDKLWKITSLRELDASDAKLLKKLPDCINIIARIEFICQMSPTICCQMSPTIELNVSATVYAHLLPNESHNFMGIILCFQRSNSIIKDVEIQYSVKNTTSGFIFCSGGPGFFFDGSLMVIVPKSIFSVTDDDHRIELTTNVNVKFVGIHLLYNTNTETETIEDVVEKHVSHIDALKLIDPVLPDIFLDIACFFIGWQKKRVVQILETYYTNVDHNIECPLKCLPSEFYPPKLVILELRHSNIRTMRELNMVPHVFEKLKTLDMSGSEDLTTTPDFTKLPCLETLNLEDCESLEEVHISIGSLSRLVSLYLHGCVKLRSLPGTICNLRALEVLDIHDCSCLEALPTAMGNLQSLRKLNAENLTISILPDSTGHLFRLVKLRLNGNKNLKTLPVTICNLRSLEILDISGCEKLEILPDQLCTITSLRQLIAGGATLLKKFPHVESSQMTLSLQKLDFSQSGITALPSGISELANLKILNLKGCMSLGILPNLSKLKQLEYLNLEDCSGLTEIQGLKGLTSIRTLHLDGCDSSLLACIFTESFFQMYSEFGHPIQVYSTEFPDWISQLSECESTMSLNLPTNMSHNYLGIVLCIRSVESFAGYSVENTTSDFIWRGYFDSSSSSGDKSLMEIVPRSTFSVEDGDDRIVLKADRHAKLYGIHLLYKTEEYDSTTVNEN